MAMEKLMYNFEELQNMTAEQILNLLLNSDKNIRMKTHTLSPLEMSALDAINMRLKHLKLKKSHEFTNTVISRLDERMCSWKRMSREEIIKAIAEARQNADQNRTILDRILGRNKSGGL